jgi:hypothetical protein
VPGFHEPELRVRQGAGEFAALFWRPGTVVAAVHDDRGLREAGHSRLRLTAQRSGDGAQQTKFRKVPGTSPQADEERGSNVRSGA